MAETTPETAQTSAPPPADVAAGPTPWSALDALDQVARLRLVVRNQDKELAQLRHLVGELLRHQHGADGAMVVPLRIVNERRDDRQPDPAKAWL